MSSNITKLAVLIDADNAQSSIASELFHEISKFGTATVKRIYGDWTTPNLKGWKDSLHRLAIQPIQQFSYTTGKNSTDSSLIIDAMDLLYSDKLDGFCLISSDSDFTRLATRLRESGMIVYGFGEKKTPISFVAACDKFIYTEILRPAENNAPNIIENSSDKKIKKTLIQAIDATVKDDGWSALSAVGSMLVKNDPSFDSRNYGFPKLSELVKNQSYLDLREQPIGNGSPGIHIYIKVKK